mgnify:CR=1 FL=1
MSRANTRVVKIGDRVIGGGNPILIQSMTNTKTEDVEATVKQIQALTEAGCDIIRCAVPTMEAAKALSEIKKQISIPLVADIHFDYRLAIAAIENGADKIRINPGKRTPDSDPRRRQQRFTRKRAGGKIQRRNGRGPGGERARQSADHRGDGL